MMEINKYVAPNSFDEVYNLLQDNKLNKIIGGGAWLKISMKKADTLIGLENLNLDYIKEENEFFEIGAMTPLRKIELNKDIRTLFSGFFNEAISKIMGVTVRNIATIGGSIMGKFAFSDLLPVLVVLDVRLKFYKIGELSFYEFLQMAKIPNDILLSIKVSKGNGLGYFHKVSKTHLDFAILNLAVVRTDRFKIAVGSRPRITKLLVNTNNFLNSQAVINDDVLLQAIEIALEEADLGDNLKASKEYREVLLKSYLKRALKQVIR